MKIIIAGGSGFIGTELIRHVSKQHKIILLTRNPADGQSMWGEMVEVVQWDGSSAGSWSNHLDGAGAVVNFTGASIGRRWTASHKQKILASRTNATKAVVEAIARAKSKPSVLVNMSGVGFYGDVPEGDVREDHTHGEDFLGSVCKAWETEALRAQDYGVRVVIPRLGVVLGKNAAALKKLSLPFMMFAGGPLGSGKQWFPWIHVDDVVGLILYAIEKNNVAGPVNATAPETVRMKEFCSVLGKVLHRPSWTPVPAIALTILLGEMSSMLLTGQKAVPDKIISAGYKFKYQTLFEALKSIIK